jgi:hypothetical protein
MFAHNENQQILWEVIQKSPYFIEYSPGHREKWFHDALSDFYYKNPVQPNSPQELLEINKRALSHLSLDLKSRLGYKSYSGAINTVISPEAAVAANLNTYNVAQDKQAKEEEMKNSYSKYQAEYHSLLQRRAPDLAEFPVQKADDKIKNMDELIQDQIRQREIDLAKFVPKVDPHTSNKIKILETADSSISKEIASIIHNASAEKSVSWSNNLVEPTPLLER